MFLHTKDEQQFREDPHDGAFYYIDTCTHSIVAEIIFWPEELQLSVVD